MPRVYHGAEAGEADANLARRGARDGGQLRQDRGRQAQRRPLVAAREPCAQGRATRARNGSGGEIPVVPYPVAQARWKLDYTYADAVGLQVLLFPEAGSGMRPNLFLMELKPTGDPAHRRWVVDSWTPSGVANPALQAPELRAAGGAAGARSACSRSIPPSSGNTESRLGAAWLFVPLALFGIVPIVLAVFGVRSWRRSRRAERAYREHAERRAGASP